MKRPPRQRPFKDERDRQIEVRSRSTALDFMTAATQVLTVICLIKDNPAWKGSLSLLFFGGAAQLFYKFEKYGESPYIITGAALGLIGLALLVWFGITG